MNKSPIEVAEHRESERSSQRAAAAIAEQENLEALRFVMGSQLGRRAVNRWLRRARNRVTSNGDSHQVMRSLGYADFGRELEDELRAHCPGDFNQMIMESVK